MDHDSLQNRKKWEIRYHQVTWVVSKTLVRRLDINVARKQAHWIKYRTRSYEKMKMKKEETLVKVEDSKVRHWQHSAGRHPQHCEIQDVKMGQNQKTSM